MKVADILRIKGSVVKTVPPHETDAKHRGFSDSAPKTAISCYPECYPSRKYASSPKRLL